MDREVSEDSLGKSSTPRMHSQLHPTSLGHPEMVQYQVPNSRCDGCSTAHKQEEVAAGDTCFHGHHTSEEGGGSIQESHPGLGEGGGCRWRWPPAHKSTGGRPLTHSSWEWSGSKWVAVPGSMTFSILAQAHWGLPQTRSKTASAFRIKKNPVPLIAPKLSLSGVDWWSDWVKTLQLLFGTERFLEMDYLIWGDFSKGFCADCCLPELRF